MRSPWMLAGALLLTSCSGGGGGAATPVAGHASAAPIAQALVTTSFVFGQLPASSSAVRRPNYVTASVASVQIVLNTVNGGAPPAGLAASVTSNLTLANCPCTVTGPVVPPGNDTFTLTAYDAQNGTGNVISKASPTLTIVAGQTNSNTIALNGVPASFTISPPAAAFGTAFAATAFSVTVKDADGHTIMGAYQNPVTLTDGDTSSATTLATSGSDSPAAGQLLSSSDAATLAYTGGAIAPVSISASASGATTASSSFAPTGVAIVTLSTDTSLGVTPGLCPAGTSGDLRAAMCNAAAGSAIVFNTTTMCGAAACTITLGAPLPPITQSETIDGGSFGRVIVDGASTYRVFWVDSGTVTLQNLQIQNAMAQGGYGGSGGGSGGGSAGLAGAGGGGAGLGAGLFVNQASAVVSVTNDYFLNCAAVGGAGGVGTSTTPSYAGAGGGGLGGSGGGTNVSYGGRGGGGVLGAGIDSGNPTGGSGGLGGGGGGGSSPGARFGGAGGTAYAGNTAGSTGIAGSPLSQSGGNGGFGGGGGGMGENGPASGVGGNGGFGGGGGGAGVGANGSGNGGNGGAGGGGGGGYLGVAGSGGVLATVSGGNGAAAQGHSGGGAAAGPAIFINAGSLTTTNSGASGSSATGGATGGAPATAGTADGTSAFNFAGMVNGSSTAGPVSSALSNTTPQATFRRQK